MKTVDGRPFECKKCGECCRWGGFVFLNPDDIKRLAEHHEIGREEYTKRYTKPHGGDIVLKDKDDSSECIYLKDDSCSVYNIRPKQCKEFPFKYDSRCPGFERKGRKAMDKFSEKTDQLNEKLSGFQEYEKSVSEKLYEDLKTNVKASSLAMKAVEEGIDDFFSMDRIVVASLDDLFAFNRVNDKTLVHKCTKDLWNIDKDGSGKVVITRLFSNDGEPIKG